MLTFLVIHYYISKISSINMVMFTLVTEIAPIVTSAFLTIVARLYVMSYIAEYGIFFVSGSRCFF